MAIDARMRPAGCSCDWEEVGIPTDHDVMIERTTADRFCRVHAKG